MSDAVATIIVGGLALVGTLLGTYAGIRKSSILTAYRLEQLELIVKQSNSVQSEKNDEVVARVVCLEKAVVVSDANYKMVDKRLCKLEGAK